MIKIKRILTFLGIILSSFTMLTMVYAEEIPVDPILSVSNTNVIQGSYGQININIENITSITALSFSVYYDDNIEITSISKSIYSQAIVDINSEVSGVIQYSMISSEALSENGIIININFQAKTSSVLGDYTIVIAAEEAYDEVLNPLSIQTENGVISIEERETQIPQVYLQQSVSKNNLLQSDVFTYSISSSSLNQLGAADFKLYYDKTLLELNNVTLGSMMIKSDAFYSVNNNTPGYVHISYATNIGITSAYPIIEFEFTVISNINQSTNITFNSSNVYNDLLQPMYIQPYEQTINLVKLEEQTDYPNISVSNYEGPNDEPFFIDINIEENSAIAAGDFKISYDHQKLLLTSLTVMDEVSTTGGMLIYNENFLNGEINFSYINENGLILGQTLLRIYFTPIYPNIDLTTNMTIQYKGLVNEFFNPIILDTVNAEINLRTYHTITFTDYDDSVIGQYRVKDGDLITEPTSPTRENTFFKEWDKTFDYAKSDLTIKAIYELDLGLVQFNSTNVIFDGNPRFIEVANLPEGASVDYGSENFIDVGVYDTQVDIYLDEIYQTTMNATLTINPKPINIVIDNQTKRFGESDPTFTYSIDGMNKEDIVPLNLYTLTNDVIGNHEITTTFIHQNYVATITKGILTVTKGIYDLSNISFEDQTFVFSGNANEIEISGELPDGVTVEYIYTENIAIGQHIVEARFNGDAENYESIDSLYATIIIEQGLFNEINGDVNFDGVVDIKDVGLIQMYIAGLRTLNPTQITYSDVNNDGIVDIKDAGRIQLFISKLIDF